MTNIPLALRLIACGLDMPRNEPSKTFGGVPFIAIPAVKTKLLVGMDWRSPRGLLYTVVATDDGPRLLPVLDDFALLGWVTTKLRALYGPHSGVVPNPNEPPIAVWGVYDDDGNLICDAPTELEALTAAWEAALKAAE